MVWLFYGLIITNWISWIHKLILRHWICLFSRAIKYLCTVTMWGANTDINAWIIKSSTYSLCSFVKMKCLSAFVLFTVSAIAFCFGNGKFNNYFEELFTVKSDIEIARKLSITSSFWGNGGWNAQKRFFWPLLDSHKYQTRFPRIFQNNWKWINFMFSDTHKYDKVYTRQWTRNALVVAQHSFRQSHLM